MTNGRKHRGDLEYSADSIRERTRDTDEARVQSTMQEETAKAIHRMAAAVEELTEAVRELDG